MGKNSALVWGFSRRAFQTDGGKSSPSLRAKQGGGTPGGEKRKKGECWGRGVDPERSLFSSKGGHGGEGAQGGNAPSIDSERGSRCASVSEKEKGNGVLGQRLSFRHLRKENERGNEFLGLGDFYGKRLCAAQCGVGEVAIWGGEILLNQEGTRGNLAASGRAKGEAKPVVGCEGKDDFVARRVANYQCGGN